MVEKACSFLVLSSKDHYRIEKIENNIWSAHNFNML